MARAVTSFIKLTLPPTTVCVYVCVRLRARVCVYGWAGISVGVSECVCVRLRARVCVYGWAGMSVGVSE